jgi:hypothetical protein
MLPAIVEFQRVTKVYRAGWLRRRRIHALREGATNASKHTSTVYLDGYTYGNATSDVTFQSVKRSEGN